MSSTDVKTKFVISFLKFLKDEVKKFEDKDQKESLEVAIQCMESSFNVTSVASESGLDLRKLFEETLAKRENEEKAKKSKELGNQLFKENKLKEAIHQYSKAIELDSTNSVYYFNRGVVYAKLKQTEDSIKDLKLAIEKRPFYSKAWNQLGLVYVFTKQYKDAYDAFYNAVKYEPANEGFKNNLNKFEKLFMLHLCCALCCTQGCYW